MSETIHRSTSSIVKELNRRDFLFTLGIGGSALARLPLRSGAAPASAAVKPILGSWFEFQHHATVEGVDWNPACTRFTCEQWDAKIKEIADTGMEYLVLMCTALYYRAFYDTRIFPKWELACSDPIEAVLSAADKYKIRFFIGGGFYGDWESPNILLRSCGGQEATPGYRGANETLQPPSELLRLVLAQ